MLFDAAAGSLSAEEERALQARGLELLHERRNDPLAPQYTPSDAEALRQRGSLLLQAHQEHLPHPSTAPSADNKPMSSEQETQPSLLTPLREQYNHDANVIAELQGTINRLHATVTQQQQEIDSLRASAPAAVAAATSQEEEASTPRMITVEEAEQAKQALLDQFSAHMEECNRANQEYWSQAQAQHQSELAAVSEARDHLQARVAELESQLAEEQSQRANLVASLETQLAEAVEARQALESQCAALTAQVQASAGLEEALADAQTALELAKQQLQGVTDEAAAQAAAAEEQLNALKDALAMRADNAASAEQHHRTLEAQLATLNEALEARDAALAAAENEQRALSAQLAAAAAAAEDAERTQADTEEAHSRETAMLQAQIAELTQQQLDQLLPPPPPEESGRSAQEQPQPTADNVADATEVVPNPFRTAAPTDLDGWDDGEAATTDTDPCTAADQGATLNPFLAVAPPPEAMTTAASPAAAFVDVHQLQDDLARLEQALADERETHAQALSAAQAELTATRQALQDAQASSAETQEALERQLHEAHAATAAAEAALAEAHAAHQATQAPAVETPAQPLQEGGSGDWGDGWGFDEGTATTPTAPAGPSPTNPFAHAAPIPPADAADRDCGTATPDALPGVGAHGTNPFLATTAAHNAAFVESDLGHASPWGVDEDVSGTTQCATAVPPADDVPPTARVSELEAALQASEDERLELLRRIAVLEAGQAALDAGAHTAMPSKGDPAHSLGFPAVNQSPSREGSVDTTPPAAEGGAGATNPFQVPGHTVTPGALADSAYDDDAIPTSPSSVAVDDSRRPEPASGSSHADVSAGLDVRDVEGVVEKHEPHARRSTSSDVLATVPAEQDELQQLRQRVHWLEAQLHAATAVHTPATEATNDGDASGDFQRTPSSVPTRPSAAVHGDDGEAAQDSALSMQVLGRQFADVQHRLSRSQEENAALREELNHLRQQCGLSPLASSDPPSQVARMRPQASLESPGAATLRHHADGGSFGAATDVAWGDTLDDTLTPADVAMHTTTSAATQARPPLSGRASTAATEVDVVAVAADAPVDAAVSGAADVVDSAHADPVDTECEDETGEAVSVSTRAARRRPGATSPELDDGDADDEEAMRHVDSVGDGRARLSPRGTMCTDEDGRGSRTADDDGNDDDGGETTSDRVTGDEALETRTELPPRRLRARMATDTGAAAMTDLGRQYAEALHQLMQADDIRSGLEADLAEAQRQLAALTEAHEAELQAFADEAEARLTELENLSRQRIEELEENLKAAESRDAESRAVQMEDPATSEVAALQAELEALKGTTETQQTTIADLLAERDTLKTALDAVEQDKKALETDMAEMVDQFEAQMNERDELLQQRLEEMENDLRAAERRAEAAVAAQAATQPPQQPTSEANSTAATASRLRELEAALADSSEALQYQQKRFQQLQAEYDAYVEDTRALRAARDLQAAGDEAASASAAAHEANARQLAALHERLEEMTAHMDAAQSDLAERESQCAALQEELAQQAHKHDDQVKRLEDQLADRVREVRELTTHNDELTSLLQDGATSVEAALAERERELKTLRADVQAQQRQNAELGDQLAQRDEALTAARAEQADLQRALAEAESAQRRVAQQLQSAQQAQERQSRENHQQVERARHEKERLEREHAEERERVAKAHQAELEACRDATDRLREELQVAQTIAATLPLEGRRFQSQFDALRQQLESALGENAQLQKTLRELRATQMDGTSTTPSADAHVNALLSRAEALDARCRDLVKEKNALLQVKDDLTVQALKAERVAEVKAQALRRQEEEVQYCRSQLASVQDDLGHRVRANQTLQAELESVHDHATAVAAAYEDLQATMSDLVHNHALASLAEDFLYAKARSIPLLLEEYMGAVCAGYTGIARAIQTDRAQLSARCDAIESTAMEAMTEGERQAEAFQAALADAQAEQTVLVRTIDGLREDLQTAEQGLAEAIEELKAARVELRETKRAAHEEVFAAQHEQQAVALEHADTLHSLALLQEEIDRAARILQKQKEQYESRIAHLEKDAEDLQTKLDAHESQVRAARSADDDDRAELLARAEEAERRCAEAMREARSVRAQLDRALPRLAQLEEEHAQRSAELLDTAQQLSALSKKANSEGEVTHRYINDLSQASQELVAANAALKKANVMHESALERLRSEVGELQHENEQLRVQRDQQAHSLENTTRRANELEVRYARDVTEVQSRQLDLDRHISGLTERNAHLQKAEQEARHALLDVQQQLASATDALARATEAHESATQQLSRQVSTLRERCAGLEEELAALQQRCNTAQTERDTKDRDWQAALREVDRLKQYLDAANEHNEALNEQLRSGRAEQAESRASVQTSLEDAQKELQRCRKVLADAEAKQLGLESDLYLLETERDKLQQELQAARAATQKAVEQYKKEQFERHEMASSLQDQVAKLYEELRAAQNTLRSLAAQLEQQRDQNGVLLDEVKAANERCKAQRVECECVKDELSAAKEEHRRERYELNAKLHDLEDALEAEQAAAAQHRQAMTHKIEVYEVSEAALRQEITDLRRDAAALEESLAERARGAATSERDQSRQLLSLHNAEEEVRLLRAQAKKDLDELNQLKLQLQQRTSELDRCTRDLATQAAQIRTEVESQQQAVVDALTAQCRKAQQALEEARAGRDHAIQASQLRQAQLDEAETRGAELEERLRMRQRELELLRHRLQAIELVAQQAAQEAALPVVSAAGAALAGEEDDSEEPTPGTAVDVPRVIDSLLDQVRQLAHGSTSTELEYRQYAELRESVAEHQLLMQRVTQLSAQPFHYTPSSTLPVGGGGSTVRRPRSTRSTPFLLEPPSRLEEPADISPGRLLSDGPATSPTAGSDAEQSVVWHPSQQSMVEQLEGASRTLTHRLESHLHTTQTALQTLSVALSSLSTSPSRTADVAAAAARKVQLTGTMLELQRRTANVNRAMARVIDLVTIAGRQSRPDAAAGGVDGSTLGGLSPIRRTDVSHSSEEPYAALTAALVAAVRVFGEAERVVLRPYNEILADAASSATTAAPAAAGATLPSAEARTTSTPARQTTSPTDKTTWF